MAVIRHIVEHLIPLIFGAILAFLFSHFRADISEHFEWWILGFIVLFLLYSYGFEGLKRLFFFEVSSRRKLCGLYVEVYSPEAGSIYVAPFLLLHSIRKDELCVFGRALLVKPQGIVASFDTPSWKSTAIALSAPVGLTRELALLFEGQKAGKTDIHGTTRVGIPSSGSGDTSGRRGYFIDTDIKEPAFRPTEDRPFGPIKDLANYVEAVRFFSIKFQPAQYAKFIESCDGIAEKLALRFKLACEPSETAFRRFLENGGLKLLADATPTDKLYTEISAILKAAVASAALPGAAPSAVAAAATAATAQPSSPGGASEHIEGTG